MPRMRLLSSSEQEAFDKPPLLDHRERKQFLNPSKAQLDIIATLRTPSGQIGFLVLCGYFKATKRFYLPRDFHERDIAAAARILELDGSDFSPNAYAKQTRARHQQLILDFHGFAPFDERSKVALVAEIVAMARTHLKPRLIFDRCVDFLIQRRIQVPTARGLADMIRTGLHERKVELITLMDAHLTDKARNLLDDLFDTPDDQNRYRSRPLETRPLILNSRLAGFDN
jgi:hypothetical protein